MAFDIMMIVGIVINVIITSIFFYLTLRLFKEDVGFSTVIGVIFLNQIVLTVFGLVLSMYLQLGIISYVLFFVVSLAIYKYGFGISWLKTIGLVIVAAIVEFVITTLLVLLGIGALIGFSLLL